MAAGKPSFAPNPVVLVKFMDMCASYSGRDKACKVIQYGSRLLMHILLKDDPKNALGNRFKGLFAMTRDARKLWRFPNAVTEYHTVLKLLENLEKEPVEQWLTVISRVGYAWYWFNDFLVYLCKAKFLLHEPALFALHSNRGWFYGIIAGIIANLMQLRRNLEASGSADTEALKKLDAARTVLVLKIIAGLGDLTVAANGIDLPRQIFGSNFNDGVLGVGGLASALIGAWQLWK